MRPVPHGFAVVGVFVRAVMAILRARAGLVNARGVAVAMVQRFGAALNPNVHVHALVLDGVFTAGPSEPAAPLSRWNRAPRE